MSPISSPASVSYQRYVYVFRLSLTFLKLLAIFTVLNIGPEIVLADRWIRINFDVANR
jgi:hypothetical protein